MSLMIGSYPANFVTEQTSEAARIVSNRNIKQGAPVGNITLNKGDGYLDGLISKIFVVSSGVSSINTLTPSADPGDQQYVLYGFGPYQYTLLEIEPNTAETITVNIAGSSDARVFRILLFYPLWSINPDSFFRRITPTLRNPSAVVHTSTRGNLSKAIHSGSSDKRRIEYESAYTEENHLSAFLNIYNTYDKFTFVRNTLVHQDSIFPAFFDGEVRYNPVTNDWTKSHIAFTVQEE